MASRNEIVEQAITFQKPTRIPIWFVNCDQAEGDVMVYHLSLNREDGSNEWGYHLQSMNDGTMGHPITAFLPDWQAFKRFKPPAIREEQRMERFADWRQVAEDRYLLASLDISGFTVYTFLRGFENSMMDFLLEKGRFAELMDMIVDFENEMISLAARRGFHGIHFVDDWATQTGLMVSPKLWRELFKPRYQKQFDHAHQEGLHVWYHCCGDCTGIVPDFYEIGVDVMNIAQPNVVDLAGIGSELRNKLCFLMPISYQTVSISGTVEEIYQEARRMYDLLGTDTGGFIGYVEEYGCMGMSPRNYRACSEAFRRLR